jgi:exosortase
MMGAYNSPNGDDGHGMLVPFVVLLLFWLKRKEMAALSLNVWLPGLVVVALGLVLHTFAYVAQFPQLSIVAFFIGLYGLTGLAWGPRWLRASFFPFFIFVFSVPLGGYGQLITFPLRLLATYLVEFISHMFGIDVVRQGTQLINPEGHYQYEVAAACGGIRSLVAILALATIFAFMTLRSKWKRFLMIVSAFPLAVIGNVTRLFSIIIAATWGGQEAGSHVHESTFFSLIPYVPAILGIILLEYFLRDRKFPEKTEEEER